MITLGKYIGDRAFYRRALAVALPIMLQNGITNFVSMLDNIMVGRVGTVEMTGVAVSNQIMFVFMLCLFGAVSGAGIFGAQFYGRKDHEGLRYCFRFKLVLCAVLTAAGIAAFALLGGDLIELFLRGEGSAEDAAASLSFAVKYLNIMMIGLVPYAAVQCYSSTLRESGETVLPMKAGITAVAVNLSLNYILIFGNFGAPRLGVAGAAIATVVSRYVELAVVAVWTHRHKKEHPFIKGAYSGFRIPAALAGRMLAGGIPIMLNETIWAAGVAVVNQCYSVRGLDVVAAVNISQTFWNVFSVVFMATGNAIGIIIGQMLGADSLDEARDADRKLIVFSVAASVLVGAVYGVCAQFIPYIYNTTDSVRSLASGFMTVGACLMPINAFIHASYFTLRSGGRTLVTFLFDSCYMWAVTAVLAFVLSRYTDMGIIPLYFCCQAADVVKCVIGFALIKKGVWVRNIVGSGGTDETEPSAYAGAAKAGQAAK